MTTDPTRINVNDLIAAVARQRDDAMQALAQANAMNASLLRDLRERDARIAELEKILVAGRDDPAVAGD